MHPISIDKNEIELLKEANERRDWKTLPTWKLRYLYQRLKVGADRGVVKEIAAEATKALREKRLQDISNYDKMQEEDGELPF